MNTITRTYRNGKNIFQFRMHYKEFGVINDSVQVVSLPGVKYGYESDDELAFFPARAEVTLSNFTQQCYKIIKSCAELYNTSFPFNFDTTLKVEIFKNNQPYFEGIVSDYSYDSNTRLLRLELTDGSEYYKNVSIENPYVLQRLGELGFQHIGLFREPGHVATPVTVYGYSEARVQLLGFGDNGYLELVLVEPQVSNFAMSVYGFLDSLVRCINPNVNFSIEHDWKFGPGPSSLNNTKSIYSLGYAFVYSNYIARYMTKPKSYPIKNLEISSQYHQYELKKVWDDGIMETWRIEAPHNTGLAEKNVAKLLQQICRNFFAVAGFHSFNKVVISKRANRNPAAYTELNDSVATRHTKQAYLQPLKYVRVWDDFAKHEALRGSKGDETENGVDFDILMSAYNTGEQSGYGIYYTDAFGINIPATSATDPVTGYTNGIAEQLAESEWEYRRRPIDKHSFTLWGTDWNFGDTFRYRDEGQLIYLRGLSMQKNEEENTTTLEAFYINNAS